MKSADLLTLRGLRSRKKLSWRRLVLVDSARSRTRLCVLGLTSGLGSLGQKRLSEGHGVGMAGGDVHGWDLL